MGVAREQARKDLPLSTYTEAYWKMDLHNLLHFLALRMDHKAQLEIREYAKIIGEKIVRKWVPIAWESFMDYRYGSISLSNDEVEILSLINSGLMDNADKMLLEAGFTAQDGDTVKPTLEGRELARKLQRLGIEVPFKV
jgi:thymidylate synthase (FAD)